MHWHMQPRKHWLWRVHQVDVCPAGRCQGWFTISSFSCFNWLHCTPARKKCWGAQLLLSSSWGKLRTNWFLTAYSQKLFLRDLARTRLVTSVESGEQLGAVSFLSVWMDVTLLACVEFIRMIKPLKTQTRLDASHGIMVLYMLYLVSFCFWHSIWDLASSCCEICEMDNPRALHCSLAVLPDTSKECKREIWWFTLTHLGSGDETVGIVEQPCRDRAL